MLKLVRSALVANRDWRLIREATSSHGLSAAKIGDLRGRRQSDTLYILGSSGSINHLDEAAWAQIRAHDSIGFNNWLLHPFVPSFFFGETPPRPDMLEGFSRNLRLRARDYARIPFLYFHWPLRYGGALSEIPDFGGLSPQLFEVFYVTGKTTEEYGKRLMRATLIRQKLQRRSSHLVLFHKVGTLSRLLDFGRLMGYHHIVLCGVDLNSTGYFFHPHRATLKEAGFYLPDTDALHGNVHSTFDPRKHAVTIVDAIRAARDYVLDPSGISLSVASAESVLTEFLPVHRFGG